MALIKKEQSVSKHDLRFKVPTDVKIEIDAYCKWAGIEDIGYFFSESAKMIFTRDKDWQKARQSSKVVDSVTD